MKKIRFLLLVIFFSLIIVELFIFPMVSAYSSINYSKIITDTNVCGQDYFSLAPYIIGDAKIAGDYVVYRKLHPTTGACEGLYARNLNSKATILVANSNLYDNVYGSLSIYSHKIVYQKNVYNYYVYDIDINKTYRIDDNYNGINKDYRFVDKNLLFSSELVSSSGSDRIYNFYICNLSKASSYDLTDYCKNNKLFLLQVTNPYEEIDYYGGLLVYSAFANNLSQVYLYDITSGKNIIVAKGNTAQEYLNSPVINENWIAYMKNNVRAPSGVIRNPLLFLCDYKNNGGIPLDQWCSHDFITGGKLYLLESPSSVVTHAYFFGSMLIPTKGYSKSFDFSDSNFYNISMRSANIVPNNEKGNFIGFVVQSGSSNSLSTFGLCKHTCVNECSIGQKRCIYHSVLGYFSDVCGNYDTDACLEYGGFDIAKQCKYGPCNSNTGDCAPQTSNECSSGQIKCTVTGGEFGVYLERCANYDSDPYLEWGMAEICSSGYCSGNSCYGSPGCSFDCTTYGSRRCNDNNLEFCANFDSDSCYEWGGAINCISGCNSGNCINGSSTKKLVANYTFEGNANDMSGNGNNGVVYGANLTTGKRGQGYSFNGINNYIQVPDSSSLDLEDELTISMWVYPKAIQNRYASHIINKWSSTSDANYVLYYFENNPGNPIGKIGFFANNNNIWSTISDYYQLNLNQWNYIAITYNSLGGQLYINGQKAGGVYGRGKLKLNNIPLRIGGNNWQDSFNGTIDEVKIWNYALNANEILNDYQSQSYKGLVANYIFEGNANDMSGNGNNGVVYGANLTSGKRGQGYSFNGINNYIQVPDSSSLDLEDELTISMWVYPKAIQNRYASHLINKWSTTSDANFVLYFFENYTGNPVGKISFFAYRNNAWGIISDSYRLNINTWNYIALAYNSSGGQLYINGVKQGNIYGRDKLKLNNVPLRIGGNNMQDSFNGTIDEVKIWNYALSSQEILNDYGSGGGVLPTLKSKSLNLLQILSIIVIFVIILAIAIYLFMKKKTASYRKVRKKRR